MTRKEKAQKIQEILEDLYPETPIPLDHHDPFTLLIAVLLSAQTTDKKVNEVTPDLFKKAPTPALMRQLTQEEIRQFIAPIGLAPQKSKSIYQLCRTLEQDFDDQIPQTLEELTTLSGVGRKTASVVLAQAFNQPAFPVDTHIHRLAYRWRLSKAKNVEQTERDLKKVFPKESWNKLHLQIIFFGREYCPALHHDLEQCPICSWAAPLKQKRLEAKTRRFQQA